MKNILIGIALILGLSGCYNANAHSRYVEDVATMAAAGALATIANAAIFDYANRRVHRHHPSYGYGNHYAPRMNCHLNCYHPGDSRGYVPPRVQHHPYPQPYSQPGYGRDYRIQHPRVIVIQ